MRILILGGTQFLGRFIAEKALAHGHELTLFHRGITNPKLFPVVEEIYGDRRKDLYELQGRQWDAVIDTCGYHPAAVARSADFFEHAADVYVFISSISVYNDFSVPRIKETASTQEWPEDADIEDDSPETYGARKALCELAVEVSYPENYLHVRPGLMTGPYDTLGRFCYWLQRIARGGGDILVPGNVSKAIQMIDARDVGLWVIKALESGQRGAFNVVGPKKPLKFGELLHRCRDFLKSTSDFRWVGETFLLEREVQPWTEIPLWIPDHLEGLHEVDASKARECGLQCRPIEETIQDTWEWMRDVKTPKFQQAPLWLTPEKEQQLLTEWKELERTPS